MKSLLISHVYFPPQVGGISHFMSAIASTLGPQQVCCLTGVQAPNLILDDISGPKIYRRPAAFAKANCIQAVGVIAAVAQIMIREQPQAVQLATINEGYLGLWLQRWLKLPFVIYAHGNEILGVMKESWPKPRLALLQAARVLANSHFTANLVHQLGVASERIEIVHPGCAVDKLQPLPFRVELRQKLLGTRYEKARVILTVGNLVARKGHDMVLRALPRVRQRVPEAVYLIVGDGPYRTELEALVSVLGIQGSVIFAGQVKDEDLADIYAVGDVFIMPSRAQVEKCDVEGFGLVFLEANACGKPVIGGRSGGIPDAIIDGETGLLVNPHDPEDIALALTRLLSNYELANRLGEQGRKRVVNDFNWPQVGERVQGIIETIVQEKSARGRNLTPR